MGKTNAMHARRQNEKCEQKYIAKCKAASEKCKGQDSAGIHGLG
jgi:hypothetical protein